MNEIEVERIKAKIAVMREDRTRLLAQAAEKDADYERAWKRYEAARDRLTLAEDYRAAMDASEHQKAASAFRGRAEDLESDIEVQLSLLAFRMGYGHRTTNIETRSEGAGAALADTLNGIATGKITVRPGSSLAWGGTPTRPDMGPPTTLTLGPSGQPR